MAALDPLRYPIGTPKLLKEISSSERKNRVDEIASAPALLRQAVAG